MKYDLERHHRRSIRLRGYDYSQDGAYFITICTQNRTCLFGKPNHVHGIIVITRAHPVGAGLVPAQSQDGATTRVAPTVGGIVGAFKSVTTVQYARGVKTHGWAPFRKRLWQRNYYEHVIRNEESLNRIRK